MLDLTEINELQKRSDSFLWKNSEHNISPDFYEKAFQKQKESRQNKFGIQKGSNNSTLSLHIAAYENSIEKASDSKSGNKNVGYRKKSKNAKEVRSAIQISFEFPRQQEEAECMDPEVMQFKASQQLFNPNQFDVSDYNNMDMTMIEGKWLLLNDDPNYEDANFVIVDTSQDNLPGTFEASTNFDELIFYKIDISPYALVRKASQESARRAEAQLKENQKNYEMIIAFHAISVLDGMIIQQPINCEEMLLVSEKVANRPYSIITGVTLLHATQQYDTFAAETIVQCDTNSDSNNMESMMIETNEKLFMDFKGVPIDEIVKRIEKILYGKNHQDTSRDEAPVVIENDDASKDREDINDNLEEGEESADQMDEPAAANDIPRSPRKSRRRFRPVFMDGESYRTKANLVVPPGYLSGREKSAKQPEAKEPSLPSDASK